MLDFKANRLIRKPYEVARYGQNTYNRIWREYGLDEMENPFKAVHSPFPIAVDIVRSIMNRKQYAAKVSDFIKSLLLVYKLVTRTELHLYTLFITTPNCCSSSDYQVVDPRNHNHNPFTSYHKSMSNLRKSWHRSNPYLHDLVSSLECTFGYRVSFNVHLHGLLGSTRSLSTATRHHIADHASRQMSNAMNSESVHVHIAPFKVERSNRLKSVTAYIHYILKQYRLPVCKSIDDYRSFMARPVAERHALVISLLNSTRGSRSTTHIIGKRSAFVRRYWNIHRAAQPELVSVPATATKPTHKHWTRRELWAKAEQVQRSQNIIKLGVKRLSKAVSSNTYKIIKVNKKATDYYSDGQNTYIKIILTTTTNDRMRASGIPP